MALTARRDSQDVSPLPLWGNGDSSKGTMIESEIVIVDEDGTEEPFDTASWLSLAEGVPSGTVGFT